MRTVRERGVNVYLRGDMGLTWVGARGGTGVPLYCKSHLHIFSQKFRGPGVVPGWGFPAYSIRLCVFFIFLSFFFILGVDFLLKICYNVLTLKGT